LSNEEKAEPERQHELEARWYEGAGRADHIGAMLADLTQSLMRDAIGGKRNHAFNAASNLAMIYKLITTAEGVSEHEIVEAAVERLSAHVPHSHPSRPTLDLAQQGALYMLDWTSADGFASARLERHWEGMQRAIEEIERKRKASDSDAAK
jgi:hypothetical protein